MPVIISNKCNISHTIRMDVSKYPQNLKSSHLGGGSSLLSKVQRAPPSLLTIVSPKVLVIDRKRISLDNYLQTHPMYSTMDDYKKNPPNSPRASNS